MNDKPNIYAEACNAIVDDTDCTPAIEHQAMFIQQGTVELLKALDAAEELCKNALPKFNWGKSALDAEAIRLLNEVPGQIRAAIAKATGQ